ncbi:hypothetical protein ASF70_15785 [Rhizobium sp. Leaf321]|uniref:hypothetical protein n=1 Tax=Rhizobium sp. Leaf321 TaxID=1736335 RepID=UPI000712E3EE|nr:hypothetical protein [Rhizobium sp. Leaf321]KQQ72931.1 hypothetical protein ASF70_15785 [Rhizobium sp. Leaf321]
MSTSDITSKFFVATGKPATFTKVGYEAMTWVQVKGVVSIGATGVSDNIIDVPDLESGFTLGVKGARSGTETEVALREVKADPGQVAFKAACDAFVEYSFKILEPTASGQAEYITGVPSNWRRNERSTTTYAGFTATVRSNYPSVFATAP